MSDQKRPFERIRVVEAAQMIAGPMAGMVLAEQGADVVKVEMADGVGDRLRQLGTRRVDTSAAFHGFNRGKRSIAVNTKDRRGREIVQRLGSQADVFIQNFRPGTAERMGIGEKQLRGENPELIYVSVSGFGGSGPRAEEKVYDYVIQAMTGIAALQVDHEGGPTLTRQFVIDKVTALTVSQAVTAALFQRERGLGGQHLEVSMLDVGLWFFWPDGMMDRAMQGDDGVTHAPHFSAAYEVRATTDGFIALVITGNRTWPGLCETFNPAWADDPRFATFELREQHSAELSDAFTEAIGAMTTEECLSRMREHDVPGAAVASLDEVPDIPQIVHNNSLVVHESGPAGLIREARPPVGWFGGDRIIAGPAPRLGEHTDEVLGELGYSMTEVAAFRRAGVLGPE
ncbi:MAG: CaiB/BaiF CoA transferase family protein [Acidimicrobiales bacterium]